RQTRQVIRQAARVFAVPDRIGRVQTCRCRCGECRPDQLSPRDHSLTTPGDKRNTPPLRSRAHTIRRITTPSWFLSLSILFFSLAGVKSRKARCGRTACSSMLRAWISRWRRRVVFLCRWPEEFCEHGLQPVRPYLVTRQLRVELVPRVHHAVQELAVFVRE